jgi:hypothetical protein
MSINPGVNPYLRGQRPATNRLRLARPANWLVMGLDVGRRQGCILSAELKNAWSSLLIPQYIFIVWCLVEKRFGYTKGHKDRNLKDTKNRPVCIKNVCTETSGVRYRAPKHLLHRYGIHSMLVHYLLCSTRPWSAVYTFLTEDLPLCRTLGGYVRAISSPLGATGVGNTPVHFTLQ